MTVLNREGFCQLQQLLCVWDNFAASSPCSLLKHQSPFLSFQKSVGALPTGTMTFTKTTPPPVHNLVVLPTMIPKILFLLVPRLYQHFLLHYRHFLLFLHVLPFTLVFMSWSPQCPLYHFSQQHSSILVLTALSLCFCCNLHIITVSTTVQLTSSAIEVSFITQKVARYLFYDLFVIPWTAHLVEMAFSSHTTPGNESCDISKLSVVAHAFSSSTWEVEAGESRPARSTE